jgi:hypothetical protein
LAAEVADDARIDPSRLDRSDIERRARERLPHWREKLAGGVAETRQTLREILSGPIVLTPKDRTYRFDGQLGAERIWGEIGLPTYVARPAGVEPATLGLEGGDRALVEPCCRCSPASDCC